MLDESLMASGVGFVSVSGAAHARLCVVYRAGRCRLVRMCSRLNSWGSVDSWGGMPGAVPPFRKLPGLGGGVSSHRAASGACVAGSNPREVLMRRDA